jgi:dihydroneopterin aldolase
MELGAKVKETVQQAHKQLHGFEEEVTKFVARVQDRILSTPADGAKKVEDLLKTIAVRDFVEKIKTIEMLKQGQAVKRELLDRFGIVGADELAALKKKVGDLEARVVKLSKPAAPKPAARKGKK